MLKTVVFAVLAWVAVSAPAFAADNAEARYQTLLTAAKSGASPIDWQALRFAYADRPTYVMDVGRDERQAMFKAFEARDWPGTLALANRILDMNYCNPVAHLVAGIANDRMGKADEAAREKAMARGIFESIKTGDGLSYAHAFTVISVGEEYDLFLTLDVDPGQQSLNQDNGHMYDVFTTKDKAGQPVTYYFNIDRVWAVESRMMGGK